MKHSEIRATRSRSGIALVLALVSLIVLTTVAVALVSVSVPEISKSHNLRCVFNARLAAESGLAFISRSAQDVQLPPGTTSETLVSSLFAKLGERLNGTSNLGGQVVSMTDDAVTIPWIELDEGRFSCSFVPVEVDGTPACRATVTGTCGTVSRRVSILLASAPRASAVFHHGVASRGKIVISGSAQLSGTNGASEASVLSASTEPVAIEAGGHAAIAGDLFVATDDASQVVLKGGGLSVGGTSDIDEILQHHVHTETEAPEFPVADAAPFADLATNVVDATTDLSGGGSVFNNIRIKAGTNPNFTSDTVLNGIVYVEAPNKVTFAASVTINGMVVTQDTGLSSSTDCEIDFRGRTTAPGVDALPDTDEFAEIKEHRGTILLGPGFAATFRGTTNAINGTIAADQLAFRGNTDISGVLTGTILGLTDKDVVLSGNTSIRVDHGQANVMPAGFKQPLGLSPVADSYVEPVAGTD